VLSLGSASSIKRAFDLVDLTEGAVEGKTFAILYPHQLKQYTRGLKSAQKTPAALVPHTSKNAGQKCGSQSKYVSFFCTLPEIRHVYLLFIDSKRQKRKLRGSNVAGEWKAKAKKERQDISHDGYIKGRQDAEEGLEQEKEEMYHAGYIQGQEDGAEELEEERQKIFESGYITGRQEEADESIGKGKEFSQKVCNGLIVQKSTEIVFIQLLQDLLGDSNEPVHLHELKKDDVYLKLLVKKEHEAGDSLSMEDLESIQDQPEWITKPGFHIGSYWLG